MGYTKVLVGHCKYDFDVDGGAATTITPAMNFHIPIGAVVLRVTGIARTALASGTGAATMAVALGGLTINAATQFDHADYVACDVHYNTPAATTAAGSLTVTLSHTFTAGEYDFYVEYLPSGDAN